MSRHADMRIDVIDDITCIHFPRASHLATDTLFLLFYHYFFFLGEVCII